VRGQLEWVRGDRARAADAMACAQRRLAQREMILLAEVARFGHGRVLGGEAGRSCMAQATRWLADQGVRNSERFVGMLAPGL